MTNFNKIKSMSVDELSAFLTLITTSCYLSAYEGKCLEDCPMYNEDFGCSHNKGDDIKEWLESSTKPVKYVIRRPIEGIFLNGFEYALTEEDGDIKLFDSEEQAREFLIEAGYTAEELQADLDACAIDIDVWEGDEK
ncbi:MAG: hypothetical protein NC253_11130 [Ruminococcus sp.]|nr:hypothetical protein [Ruminococcus sp.]MCM1380300.1 hypothetical protein [Muribaculaceae bacterium]MCM1478280.1 hypothetical protein [Muribaculaceae bacterium]